MTRPTLGSAKESPSWLGRPAPALRGCAQIELYSLRWQIELFFKELKSTLGFAQYSFHNFDAVKAWVQTAITTVLYLETLRAERMQDRRLSPGPSPLVGDSTPARPVQRLPPRMHRPRTQISVRAPQNFRRHRKTQTPARHSNPHRIPSRHVIFTEIAQLQNLRFGLHRGHE